MEGVLPIKPSGMDLSTAEEAYRRLRPACLRLLGALARQGYPLNPADGIDLIHDFFVEAWPGLGERFRPEKGDFDRYWRGAFIRFARRRILKALHWQRSLTPVEELEIHLLSPVDREDPSDLAAVRSALDALPSKDRQLLELLVDPTVSMRSAARRIGLSRHRLRIEAGEALGRLSMKLGTAPIGRDEWSVANELWSHGRDLRAAAARLGLTYEDARARRNLALHQLNTAVQSAKHSRLQPRTKETKVSIDLLALWKAFLADPDDEELRGRVRRSLRELLDFLETDDAADSLVCRDPERLAKAYSEIASALDLPEQRGNALFERLQQARSDDDAAIERAVTESLLEHPSANADRVRALGFPDRLSGLQIFLAIDAVALLAERLYRARRNSNPEVRLGRADEKAGCVLVDGHVVAKSKVVDREIARLAEVPESIARGLREWIFTIAGAIPSLFLGFETRDKYAEGVLLAPQPRRNDEDLFERWSPVQAGLWNREVEEVVPAALARSDET
jgi:DNA-directed RNA polymerase specialized sigma24 family protein